jgi:hypothetical protein
MYTLYVEGVPAIKLGSTSEIPDKEGIESWKVVDAAGNIIDSYR